MDVIGWFALGGLTALVTGSSLWGRAVARKRAAGARHWATAAGLTELSPGAEGVRSDLVVPRSSTIPSFSGVLGGRPVSVIASSIKPRLGDLWALCTHAQRPPLFLGSRLGFSTAKVFGRSAPRGWVPAKAEPALEKHYLASVPAEGHPVVLSSDAQAALLEAGVHAWCLSAAPGGFVVLWFKQTYGQDTNEALTKAARLLSRILAD